MNRCPESAHVQDWLDGALASADSARFEAHLAGCEACADEVAAFRTVFAELDALPLLDPRPELYDRIVAEVLPHRAPPWVRFVVGVYAGALVACLGILVGALLRPGPGNWVQALLAAGVRAVADTSMFVIGSVGEGLARTVGFLAGEGLLALMLRVLVSTFGQPLVLLLVLAATLVCAAVLWWMRPRERDAHPEVTRVGLLAL
jgi:hypothetical protein